MNPGVGYGPCADSTMINVDGPTRLGSQSFYLAFTLDTLGMSSFIPSNSLSILLSVGVYFLYYFRNVIHNIANIAIQVFTYSC